MNDLIKALTILSKYTASEYPTWCEHDELHVRVNPILVSEEDVKELNELGFFPDEHYNFCSFRFGSC